MFNLEIAYIKNVVSGWINLDNWVSNSTYVAVVFLALIFLSIPLFFVALYGLLVLIFGEQAIVIKKTVVETLSEIEREEIKPFRWYLVTTDDGNSKYVNTNWEDGIYQMFPNNKVIKKTVVDEKTTKLYELMFRDDVTRIVKADSPQEAGATVSEKEKHNFSGIERVL